jgi:hypothetical protein
MESSLFVAATTNTLCELPALVIPSISLRRVVNTLLCTPEAAPELSVSLFMANESNSSKKRIHGDADLALEKIERIVASDPPSH